MNLLRLLEGPSWVTCVHGPTQEIIRLAPGRAEPEFRKVNIAYSPVTVTCHFLFPWLKPLVTESWNVTATIRLRDGRRYVISKLVRLDFNRAVEFVMLETVKVATMDKLKQIEARLVG